MNVSLIDLEKMIISIAFSVFSTAIFNNRKKDVMKDDIQIVNDKLILFSDWELSFCLFAKNCIAISIKTVAIIATRIGKNRLCWFMLF
jgi:hypothetical protein